MLTETDLTDAEKIGVWHRRNYGICARIGREFDVTGEFVRQILYGVRSARSADLRIERALIDAGAPFIADRIAEVAQ